MIKHTLIREYYYDEYDKDPARTSREDLDEFLDSIPDDYRDHLGNLEGTLKLTVEWETK